jgi:hypothetical protein
MDALDILIKHDREQFTGMFKRRYPLVGRAWLRNIPAEDRKIFSEIGCENHQHGHKGGIARAIAAKRDARGRFKKGEEDV